MTNPYQASKRGWRLTRNFTE